MSRLTESCSGCGWRFERNFQYHGEVPVEHPICPSCGGELGWLYDFEAAEVGMSPAEMVAHISLDETGLPVDGSPATLRLGVLIDEKLEALTGVPFRVTNVEGVVDLELRPYIDCQKGIEGAKAIANVGSSIYSMGLLELLVRLNGQLPIGHVVPHTSAYGLPVGAVELFSFGAEVGLYFQHVLPTEDLENDRWLDDFDQCKQIAAALARQLRSASRMLEMPLPMQGSGAGLGEGGEADIDEISTSSFGSMRLEDVQETLLEDLLIPEPDEEEMVSRIGEFLDELGIEPNESAPGVFLFKQDSARIRVSFSRRAGRSLVQYRSVLLSGIDLTRFQGTDSDLPAKALTALNDQIIAGRCLIEPEAPGEEQGPYHIVFEKSLLGADLDLSEFALTLAMVGEEADRMDNLLQDTFGGLRADELEHPDDAAPATDLAQLIQRLSTTGLPDHTRLGADKVRLQVHHMLEELRLLAHQDDHEDFWFTFGSARFVARIWQDERATYITLRARVLRDVERTEGLAEALNDINRQIRFGAFVRMGDHHVDLVETILADDLSVEEFAFALVSVGELADIQDDRLKALFGGRMGNE